MRITNSHIYGQALNNIWRNARHLHDLVVQIETKKRIQRPSEDPLLASRALRYRTILAETEQFMRNAAQGMAWMEVSESAFNSILTGNPPTSPSIVQSIFSRLLEAANAPLELADQLAIVAELREKFDQMFGIEMNQTYLGRYVFSGFHTNQPPVLKQDWPGRSFIITQTFNADDIEETLAFHRPHHAARAEVIYTNIIKLPFTNLDFDFDTSGISNQNILPEIGIFGPDGQEFHIISLDSSLYEAYRPDDLFNGLPVIHHIVDTGELVMSDATREIFQNGTTVTFEARDLVAGELNPIIYFDSFEVISDTAEPFSSRVMPFSATRQNIKMEISPQSYITVNSHASNILTANLFSDLRRLFDFADSLVLSDPRVITEYYRNPPHELTEHELTNAVETFLSEERRAFASAMYSRINNQLERIMQHATQAQREHTNLGSRMARLAMIDIRLEEDKVSITALLSENEDIDQPATLMRLDGAEAAFGFALQAIARTTQLTLADFINR
ncbi:MAG: hypothetical protein FWF79_05815 [Defluviitaleaceae bacterium]|nr:hypothetical protein [Defluviitaleaceae bacterium]